MLVDLDKILISDFCTFVCDFTLADGKALAKIF